MLLLEVDRCAGGNGSIGKLLKVRCMISSYLIRDDDGCYEAVLRKTERWTVFFLTFPMLYTIHS